MRTLLLGKSARLRGSVAVAAGLLAIGGLAAYAGTAGAAPQPSVSTVQQQVNQLTSKYDQANQSYDQAVQDYQSARKQLSKLNATLATARKNFNQTRGVLAQMAAASYENGNTTSIASLLTSSNPQTVIDQGSLLLELSGVQNAEAKQFLANAHQLSLDQAKMAAGVTALDALKVKAEALKQHIGALLDSKKATLASLTTTQQTEVAANSLGGGATTATAYTGTTATQGGQAAAFAVQMAQDKCPYVYGATGPCQDGYDCSGLAQAAWASAHVSIPRTTYEDWSSLPHVSMSSLEPGDLILYDGEGHVAIYVGGGMIVDAPQSGEDVEEISMNESWYAANEDGAVRP